MKQRQTENTFNANPSLSTHTLYTDITIEEWQATRLDMMLRIWKEFNVSYREVDQYVKDNENIDIENEIGLIGDYPLSIDYIEPDVNDTPPHWQYLISYGGPGSEIRFFVNHKSSTEPYKVEFWYSDWFNSVGQDVTDEAIIEHLWEHALLPLTEQMDTQNEELPGEAQETDPLLALAGSLKWDDIGSIDTVLPPEIRVVKGKDEDNPDPLLALAGTLKSNVTDISERHDDYIAAALLAELRGNKGE